MESEEDNEALCRDPIKTTSLARDHVVENLRDRKIKSERILEYHV